MYENGCNIGNVPDCPECERNNRHVERLERRTAAIIEWLEKNQPDVFKRGLWGRESLDLLMKRGTCTWAEDEDGNWDTGCRNLFRIDNGTPTENGMKFCCYCGKPLKESL